MALFGRLSRRCSVGAVAFAILALAANSPELAAKDRARPLGSYPVVGSLEVCFYSEFGSLPTEPLSALAMHGGDSLLVEWDSAGSKRSARSLFWLSPDGYTLRAVGSDVPPGRILGAVRLLDDRALVAAEEGIFFLGDDHVLKRMVDCEQTGVAQIVQRADGEVLTFSNGDLLVHAQRGVLRMSPQGRLESMGMPPPGTESFQRLEDDTVLASGTFGHYLLSGEGRTTPVATGLLARAVISVREAKPEMRGMPSSSGELARELGAASPPFPNGAAVVDASGRAVWARLPDDVTMALPFELEDGRLFALTERGLLRLREDGTTRRVSATVRLRCADSEPESPRLLGTLTAGRTLVVAYDSVFVIDRKDRVRVIASGSACTDAFQESDVAATTDGMVYFVKDDALYGADSDGRAVVIAGADATGTIYSIESFDADLLVHAEQGRFHVRKGRPFKRVVPTDAYGRPVLGTDLDGRPLICVDGKALHRLDSEGLLQPLPSVAGVPCERGVESVGSIGMLVRGGQEGRVLITRDDRAIMIPGARVWPVAQLQDGSAVLLTMPAGRYERETAFDPDELARIPHSLIRVAAGDRIEPVAFEGPDVAPVPPVDPTWLERRQIRALQFSSPARGWAILGERGVLATTVDAGVNWSSVLVDGKPLEGLAALSFTADGRHGIAAGRDTVWRTDDGGADWKPLPWSLKIFDVQQVQLLEPEGSRAYAVVARFGEDEILTDLLVSNDGGRAWSQQPLPIVAVGSVVDSQLAIGFDTTGSNGWLVVRDRLLTTGDRGSTWQTLADLRDFREIEARRWRFEMPRLAAMFGEVVAQSLPTVPVGVAYWSTDARWCVSRGKLFCIVADGASGQGSSQEVELEADVVVAAMAVAGDAHHAWAVGTGGTILATEDGGKTWAAQTSGVRGTIAGIFFLPDALHGWAWGEDGLLATRDGGTSWRLVGSLYTE